MSWIALDDRLKQVDDFVASVKLDAGASGVAVGTQGEALEGRRDELGDVRTLEANAGVAAARKLASL